MRSALNRLRATPVQRLVRFGLTGAFIAVVHIAIVTTTVGLLDAPVQPALVLAYVIAICLHFTMNRNLVFATGHGYALHLSAQGIRYLGLALFSYIVTATSVAVLPDVLGIPVLVVYLATIACLSVVSFTVLQGLIFHAGEEAEEADPRAASPSTRFGEPD
jgi:putative flippase GtrA